MKYRNFCGEQVSVLGYGGMRFPLDKEGKIDREESTKLVMAAYEKGVNYFDTAYFYHNQESEEFFGEALEKVRDKVYIATKSPVYDLKSEEDFDLRFENQLKRLRTDYIDFYLLHALDRKSWENIVVKFDIVSKIRRLKEEGRVKHIGFSFHDDIDTFKEIVDNFEGCEFCQIQYNYIDLEHQAGTAGLEYAHEKGLGVVIMEPLLGGKLANPPAMVNKALDKSKAPVEWALDFLWNRKEISVLLSGMGEMKQVEENIAYADKAEVGMLTPKELDMLLEVRDVYFKNAIVPCTKCQYCMPCPAGLNIPEIYDAYNATVSKGMDEARKMYDAIAHKADECIGCNVCEQKCPQAINPGGYMTDIDRIFNKKE